MDWIIKNADIAPESMAELGNKYLIGNGYMGIRGTLDEHEKNELAAVNLSGIFDKCGDGWREPLNAPNALFAYVSDAQKDYRLPEVKPFSHTQTLDFRYGIHSRKTVWQTQQGLLTVESQRFVSMVDIHLIMQRIRITTDYDGQLTLTAGIDGDVWDINGPHYESLDYFRAREFNQIVGVTGEKQSRVAVCEKTTSLRPTQETAAIADKKLLHTISFLANKGKETNFTRYIGVSTTNDTANPEAEASTCVIKAEANGWENELEAHCNRWEQLWQISEVCIEGDNGAMQALNYSIYHLHCIAPRHSSSMSIPARGLSGQTYKGAVFWDTEMFMLDFYLHTEPEVAKSLLRYRIDTLEGALAKAKEYGYAGAFYAWESQDGGFDACSDYNVTDVFTKRPMRTYFKDKQIHISSAIAYGIMKYVHYTGDTSLLVNGGARTIFECAKFYYSALTKRVCKNEYELCDVIGPDEYHERVDNNAYTNKMARFTFEAALDAAKLLKGLAPNEYSRLCEQGCAEELLSNIPQAIHLLKQQEPDAQTGVIEQFDGYFQLEDISLQGLKKRVLHPKEYWGGANGIAAHTKIIKQADVVTMLNLFSDEYPYDVLQSNWEYYEPRTEHGSSLSACMYALLACKCGSPEAAYPFFEKSVYADLSGGGKQWAGLIYIGGTHPAASGGAWMTAIFGFGGLCVKEGTVAVNPHLPKAWKRLRFHIVYQGETYCIDITPDNTSIEKCGGHPLPVSRSLSV